MGLVTTCSEAWKSWRQQSLLTILRTWIARTRRIKRAAILGNISRISSPGVTAFPTSWYRQTRRSEPQSFSSLIDHFRCPSAPPPSWSVLTRSRPSTPPVSPPARGSSSRSSSQRTIAISRRSRESFTPMKNWKERVKKMFLFLWFWKVYIMKINEEA